MVIPFLGEVLQTNMTVTAPAFSGRAVEFRSPSEVQSTRPEFDATCSITIESFAGIVGRCAFAESERVLCQLEIKNSVCRQEHGNGWLVKRKDGREGYIGKDCANRHFGADRNFAAATSKARRELRIDALLSRLKQHLTDPNIAQRITDAITRRLLLREKMQALRDSLPQTACTRIRDMAKSGNPRVVVEFRRMDENDRGDEIVVWEPATIGSIVGLGGLDFGKLHDVGERLRIAQSALKQATPSHGQKESALRKWVEALDDVERCRRELDRITVDLREFQQPQNYRALCWAISSDRDQLEIVRLAFQLQGKKINASEAHEVRKTWHKAIRETANGCDFRVP